MNNNPYLPPATAGGVSKSNYDGSGNLYLYLGQHMDIQALDLADKKGVFDCGKAMAAEGKTFYSRKLDDKGASRVEIAPDYRAATADNAKIQKKAYRANTQSRQVDGLFKPDKFTARATLLNHTRANFNILRPCEARQTSMKTTIKPEKILKQIKRGQCHQIYGISEFRQNNRLAGLKLHEKYQGAVAGNGKVFRRKNGEFT